MTKHSNGRPTSKIEGTDGALVTTEEAKQRVADRRTKVSSSICHWSPADYDDYPVFAAECDREQQVSDAVGPVIAYLESFISGVALAETLKPFLLPPPVDPDVEAVTAICEKFGIEKRPHRTVVLAIEDAIKYGRENPK